MPGTESHRHAEKENRVKCPMCGKEVPEPEVLLLEHDGGHCWFHAECWTKVKQFIEQIKKANP